MLINYRFFITVAMAAAMMLMLTAAPAKTAEVDRIVAVVNGEIITLRQLNSRVGALSKAQKLPAGSQAELRRKVLDALIEQELVNQVAKKKGLMVAEGEVAEAIDAIKKDNNVNDAQLRTSLAKGGTSYEAFKDDLRFEILKNRVLGTQIMSKIVVTENEVTAFMRGDGPSLDSSVLLPSLSVPGSGAGGNDAMGVRLLVIPKSAKAMAEANRIKAEIEKGLPFAEAVSKYSTGPGKDEGGNPGDDVTVAQLNPPLRTAAAGLKPGQPSQPVDMGEAVVLMTVADTGRKADSSGSRSKPGKRGSADEEFSPEARAQARKQLESYKMQQRYAEWMNDLKNKAIIKITL